MIPTTWSEDITDYIMEEDTCPICEGNGRIVSFNSELKSSDLSSLAYKRKR